MRSSTVALVAVIQIVGSGVCQGQEALRKTPPLRTAELPRPPGQAQPWRPPATAMPAFFVEAATTLFSQGFADPRWCDYREVELAGEAGPSGDPKNPRPVTHAWVLPTGSIDGPRFVVAWNGLVYPLGSLGVGADLEADVQTLVARARESREARQKQPAGYRGESSWSFLFGAMADHRQTASQDSLTPAKVCLLLGLGRADLAEKLWVEGTGEKLGTVKSNLTEWGVSYLTMAGDWAWALLDRAAIAHQNGDDPLARATLSELARIQPLIETTCGAMHFERPINFNPDRRVLPYLGFLGQVQRLLSDQERRAHEPRRSASVPTTIPDQSDRIAALVGEFDRIGGDAYAWPGRDAAAGNSAVQSVIKEGEGAVSALLDCLEHDNRLTRIVARDYSHNNRYIHVQGVDEVAYSTLVTILGTRQFGPNSQYYRGSDADQARRTSVVGEIRPYWLKTRGMSEAERHFRSLPTTTPRPSNGSTRRKPSHSPATSSEEAGSTQCTRRGGGSYHPQEGNHCGDEKTLALPS